MKCLRKYQWVKLPRDIPDMGKGLMAYWAMLASRSAFRKGNASYCGHSNPVAPGMWAGGIVGLKSILGVRSRAKALQILGELSSLGFLKYSLDSQTKKLTYEITDWVVKCSGAECMSGTVYASTGYGFLCLPRSITQRLVAAKRVFDEADAWLDLWCHTTYEDYGNAFSFLAPVVQYGRFGSVLTLETLGERWSWEKTKVWRFFKKHGDVFSLYRLPSSYGCLVFNAAYPTGAGIQLPEQEMVMRILREILICSTYKYKGNSENLRVNHMVAWYSKTVISSQQLQSAPEISECRVALSAPITRAYLSHGWNCKHCRNYHYACPGMTMENSAQPMWKPFVTSRRPPDSLSLKSAEISNESPQKEKCNQMAMVVNLTIMAFFHSKMEVIPWPSRKKIRSAMVKTISVKLPGKQFRQRSKSPMMLPQRQP